MRDDRSEKTGGLSRRGLLGTAGMAALGGSVLAGSGWRPARAADKAPESIRASFFVETKPTMIGKAQGWFEQMSGAPIQWSEVGSGAEVNAAMAAGSLDVAFGLGSSPSAAGLSQGIGYKIIAMVDNIGPAEDMVVKKSANIKKPEDLKGKSVATPFGSTSHFRLLGFLKLHGLTQSDVNVLDMKPDAEVAAWKRGDIQAAYVWSPAKAKMLEDGGEIYSTYKELDAAGYVIGDLIVASNAFIKDYPEAAMGLIAAYGKALALWKSKPEDAAKIVGEAAGVSTETAMHDMKEYDFVSLKDQLGPEWLGKPGKPGKFAHVLKTTADFLVEQKSIRKAPDLATFEKGIDTSLLAKVAKS